MSSNCPFEKAIFVLDRICFIYWIITVPIYTFIMLVLIHAQRKKVVNLTSSFYKLCISAGFTDIVTLLTNYFGAIFPRWGWFSSIYSAIGEQWMYIYLIISWGSVINQSFSVSLLAANRLSAILFPRLYDKLWHGRRLIIAVIIQHVTGYIFPWYFSKSTVQLQKTRIGGVVLQITDKKLTSAHSALAGLILAGNSMFLVAAYSYLFYAIRKRHAAQLQAGAIVQVKRGLNADFLKRREYRLLMVASTIVAIQMAILLLVLASLFPWFPLTGGEFQILYIQLSVVYSGVSPYLLWIFCDALRHYVVCKVLRVKRSVNPTVIMVSSWCSARGKSEKGSPVA